MDPIVVLDRPSWEFGLNQHGMQAIKTSPHCLSVHQTSGLVMVAAGSSSLIFTACKQEEPVLQAHAQCPSSTVPVSCVSVRRAQGEDEASLGLVLRGNVAYLIDLITGRIVHEEILTDGCEWVNAEWHPRQNHIFGVSTKTSLHVCIAADPYVGTSQCKHGSMSKGVIQAARNAVPKLSSWAWLHSGDGAIVLWNGEIEIVKIQDLEGLGSNGESLDQNLMRRRVLLGVPGMIRTVGAGPASSILCTVDAPVCFHSGQLNETNLPRAPAEDGFKGSTVHESDVIDLRGNWLEGSDKKQCSIETLLQMEQAAQQVVPPGRLCIIWQFLNSQQNQPSRAPAATSPQGTLLCLPCPIPDLLHVTKNLVLVSSSYGPPVISVFHVKRTGGEFIMTLHLNVDPQADTRILDFGMHLDSNKNTVSVITKTASPDRPNPTIFHTSSQRLSDAVDTKLHHWDATDAFNRMQGVLFPVAEVLPLSSSADPVVQISEMLQTFQQKISVQMDQILSTMESLDRRLSAIEKRSSGM